MLGRSAAAPTAENKISNKLTQRHRGTERELSEPFAADFFFIVFSVALCLCVRSLSNPETALVARRHPLSFARQTSGRPCRPPWLAALPIGPLSRRCPVTSQTV